MHASTGRGAVRVCGGTFIDHHMEGLGLEPGVSEANRRGRSGMWRKSRVVWECRDDLMSDSVP